MLHLIARIAYSLQVPKIISPSFAYREFMVYRKPFETYMVSAYRTFSAVPCVNCFPFSSCKFSLCHRYSPAFKSSDSCSYSGVLTKSSESCTPNCADTFLKFSAIFCGARLSLCATLSMTFR